MSFTSYTYIIFLPIMVIGYFLLPKKLKHIWLLIGSYYFYMNWNPKYALLMLVSTIITFLSGIMIGKANKIDDSAKATRRKRLAIAISFVSNLGILFFFKYFGFVNESLEYILGLLNIEYTATSFSFLLPVGISFYTFQALSYTMDVYRKKIKTQHNFIRYALFVSFFPQLVAGPIEKSRNLIPQLEKHNKFKYENMRQGLLMILFGFVKKLVIADRVAILVNTVYNDPYNYEGFSLVIATVFFAIQIYCDFSAYSDIARGSAKLIGIELMLNFERPYLSQSIGEFWRRWHRSLNDWFRENLYFPLGGNKKGEVRKHFNIIIVFLASGLWHGAGLTFIVWGALNALFYISETYIKKTYNRIRKPEITESKPWSRKVVNIIVTFVLINITWIFFRANSISDGIYILQNVFVNNYHELFNGTALYTLGLNQVNFNIAFFATLILILVEVKMNQDQQVESILKASLVVRWLIYLILVVSVLVFGIYGAAFDATQFIYFQF